MDAYFYILHSQKLGRFYSGITTLDPSQRLENHVNKIYGNSNFTRKADDWNLFLAIKCQDFSQARKLEIHIKKMKSSTYIQNLKMYPEIIEKLLSKFKSF
ncbi:MAG: GIY-YIG nuclease family protein [Mongoliibacter sp.]|uniref:GIY-YIG nuclease family protein n=1 Tax=Mongoliibacter sp. TaxID=2022438 RepID=UPI0012F3ACFC|nr:MAG: GIY-YIG nuclease family protein [Mongoliibacter sp.]